MPVVSHPLLQPRMFCVKGWVNYGFFVFKTRLIDLGQTVWGFFDYFGQAHLVTLLNTGISNKGCRDVVNLKAAFAILASLSLKFHADI